MDFVNELCKLHDYIKENFEDAEFTNAETPENYLHEKVAIRFTFNGRQYKYALTDETQEEKAE